MGPVQESPALGLKAQEAAMLLWAYAHPGAGPQGATGFGATSPSGCGLEVCGALSLGQVTTVCTVGMPTGEDLL